VVVCDCMLGPVAVLLCNRCCLGSYGRSVALSEGVAGAWWIKLRGVWAVQRGVVLRQQAAAACTLQYSTVLYCSNFSKAGERASLQLPAPGTRDMRICVCLSSGWYEKDASSPTVVCVRLVTAQGSVQVPRWCTSA
jgi:hypothetical protein